MSEKNKKERLACIKNYEFIRESLQCILVNWRPELKILQMVIFLYFFLFSLNPSANKRVPVDASQY